MAGHFNDAPGSYRAFSRRTPKGFHGTAFQSSRIIEYDPSVKDDQDWDLVRLLNRTIVSAWARLDPEEDCGGGGFANAWFTDGLSLLYTVFLPSRFGQRGPDYFRATVNVLHQPARRSRAAGGGPLRPVGSHGPSWYASSARAYRAFVYMLSLRWTRSCGGRLLRGARAC